MEDAMGTTLNGRRSRPVDRLRSVIAAGARAGRLYNEARVDAGLAPEVYDPDCSDWHEEDWNTWRADHHVRNDAEFFEAFTRAFVKATQGTAVASER
jgi:hypothetical protein